MPENSDKNEIIDDNMLDEAEKKPEAEKSAKKFLLCYKPFSLKKWILLPGLFDTEKAALVKFSSYKIAGTTSITELSFNS